LPPIWTTIPDVEIPKFTSKLIAIDQYLSDPESRPLTLEGSYTFNNGGTSIIIPSGVFTSLNSTILEIISTDSLDVGTYSITLKGSDEGSLSAETTFSLTIINRAPIFIDPIQHITFPNRYTQPINLTTNFTDPDNDEIIMKVTFFDLNGIFPVEIPEGELFKIISPFYIEVVSTAVADIGLYRIDIVVEDIEPLSVSVSIDVNITH